MGPDIFELQDQVTENVVGAIAPISSQQMNVQSGSQPTAWMRATLFAWDDGPAPGHQGSIDEALAQFNRALQLDPNSASAHAMAAWCHFCARSTWMTDRPREIAEGVRLARRAVELGGDDAVALTRSGHALAHLTDDLDGGIALIDRALVLNPNLASAWFLADS